MRKRNGIMSSRRVFYRSLDWRQGGTYFIDNQGISPYEKFGLTIVLVFNALQISLTLIRDFGAGGTSRHRQYNNTTVK